VTFSSHGIGISTTRQVAIGAAFLLQRGPLDIAPRLIPEEMVEAEVERFRKALNTARDRLRAVRQHLPTGTAEDISSFIDTHLLMLDDSAISQAPIELIRTHQYAAEWALQRRRNELVRVFDEMDDPYLRTRRDDVEHVVGQIQIALQQGTGRDEAPSDLTNHIVVARDLTPADIIMLKNRGVIAFVTEYGGPLSHTAILARSLGIAAVLGVHHASQLLRAGETLIVDGEAGVVLADPTREILQHYQQRIIAQAAREAELRRNLDLPAITRDGQRILLLANIELPEDITATLANRADGVGLFRTEFLYMNRTTPPSEEEQLETYLSAVHGLNGAPLTIRTLDLGADKTIECSDPNCPPSNNPALGLRAIRLCLKEPDLFLPQLRAILRASAEGQVRLMIPMLSCIAELQETLALLEQTKQELSREGLRFNATMPVGGMIEIPAAAIAAASFARQLDFLSIGTNDLIQYTLAVDRMDESVNYLFDPLHPSVLQLIQMTIHAANNAGIPISMCGEMAGDPLFTQLLLGMGLRELSMQPGALLETRQVVRASDLPRLTRQAQAFLQQMHSKPAATLFAELFH